MNLEADGIEVVAVGLDPPDRAAAHRRRDGLGMVLLADPDGQLARRFGLVHRRGLVHATVIVFGVPIGVPTGFRDLVIPTTLLIDEDGVIRWVDQASDYRIRSDEARIRAAIDMAFGDADVDQRDTGTST